MGDFILCNDQEMSTSLSEFKKRQENEQNYDQKFWLQMIENFCKCKGSAEFTIEELKTFFQRNGTVVPEYLTAVVNKMSLEGNLVPKDDFMQNPKDNPGWAIGSLFINPLKILSWLATKLTEKTVTIQSVIEKRVIICKSVLKTQSKLLFDVIKKNHNESLLSMDDLMQIIKQIDGISKEGALFALDHLKVEGKVFIDEENSSQPGQKILLKFADAFDSDKSVAPITDIDRSIYNLEHTEICLKSEIDELETKIDESIKTALHCKRDGKVKWALFNMKRKRRTEENIIKKLNVLESIQNMLQILRSFSFDREILETYKMSISAMKSTSEMDLDNVHGIIDEMQDILMNHEDCQNAMSRSIVGSNQCDHAELDKELQKLVEATENDTNHKTDLVDSNLSKLPNVGKYLDNLDLEVEERMRSLRSYYDDEMELTKDFNNPQKHQNKKIKLAV